MKRSEITKSITIASRKETIDRSGKYDKAGRTINDSQVAYICDQAKYPYLPDFFIRVDLFATSRHVEKGDIYFFVHHLKVGEYLIQHQLEKLNNGSLTSS